MFFYKAFPSFARGALLGDSTEQALAAAMVKAWSNFAWHGSPDTLSWPKWNSSEPTLQLGLTDATSTQLAEVIHDYQRDACKVIDERIQPMKHGSASDVSQA